MNQEQHSHYSIGMGRTLRSRTSNYYAVLADTGETTPLVWSSKRQLQGSVAPWRKSLLQGRF